MKIIPVTLMTIFIAWQMPFNGSLEDKELSIKLIKSIDDRIDHPKNNQNQVKIDDYFNPIHEPLDDSNR